VRRDAGAGRDGARHGAGAGGRGAGGRRPERFEPRRGEGSARPDTAGEETQERDPVVPEEFTGSELDRDVKAQLRGLGTDYARIVGRHLVATHYYLDTDPELAWRHALAARRRAARLGVVREAVGLAAYNSGRYADALAEFRTARRLTGSSSTLPLMADSERGLGRPERALELARAPEAQTLDQDGRVELLIVTAGARRDLGEPEAALVALQVPELEATGEAPWLARLRYAYAEALDDVGRADEAATWRARALEADPGGEAGLTDAAGDEDDVVVLDLLDDFDDEPSTDPADAVDAEDAVDVEDDVEVGADAIDDGGDLAAADDAPGVEPAGPAGPTGNENEDEAGAASGDVEAPDSDDPRHAASGRPGGASADPSGDAS
jgi:tetratricopeptide (TPR) repeat protein